VNDGDKLHKARADGSVALSILNDEMVQGAFTSLKNSYSERLFNTTIDQTVAREKLYMAARVVDEVQRHLQSIADNGKIAESELNRLINDAEAKRKWQDIR
jgi:hypothetical protein